MKNCILLSLTVFCIIFNITAKAENLPGKTRNLNMTPVLNKHMAMLLYATQDDSQNILYDLASHCDDRDFEMNARVSIKPFAILSDIRQKALFSAPGALINGTSEQSFLENILFSIQNQYEEEVEQNAFAFGNNLKELLSLPGKDGKTAREILKGKSGIDCSALSLLFDTIEQKVDEINQKKAQADALLQQKQRQNQMSRDVV
jgi:hypothetical protein